MKKKMICRIASVCLALSIFLCNFPIVARAAVTVIIMTIVSGPGTGYTYADNTVTITTNGAYKVIGATTTKRIVIADGVTATVTLDAASITPSTAGAAAIQLKGSAQLILTLSRANVLTGGPGAPGLGVPTGAALTIIGRGSLTATCGSGNSSGAGIGGGLGEAGGTVTINGGTVTAIGGGIMDSGAGIGGGGIGDGGTVTINGGTVTATGGGYAAGIGGGNGGAGGVATINGGTVTANGGEQAAGIGSGFLGGVGAVTINGGTVTANGGKYGAGIGGAGGTVTISSGTVTANGGEGAAGIGGRLGHAGGTVSISGGTVTANGGENAAGIGGGLSAAGGTVTIDGGTVTATGSDGGAGIGSGNGGAAEGTLTINGGSVKADPLVVQPENQSSKAVYLGELANQSGVSTVLVDGVSYHIRRNHNQDNGLYLYMQHEAGGNETYPVNVKIGGSTIRYTATWAEASTSFTFDAGTPLVNLAETTVSVELSAATVPYPSTSITVTATVTDDYVELFPGVEMGDVAFYVGDAADPFALKSVDDHDEATATLDISNWDEGVFAIKAVYSGSVGSKSSEDEATLTVAPKALAVTGLTAKDKEYDGTTGVGIVSTAPKLEGIVDGDEVELAGDIHFAFADADVGANKDVVVTNAHPLTGAQVHNYSVAPLKATITEKSLTGATIITLAATSFPYTGSEIEPTVSSVSVDGLTIPADDCAVAYSDNKNPGTATVTVTAKDNTNFSGSASTTFEILSPPAPPSPIYQPTISGELALSGSAGHMAAQQAVVQLSGATFGDSFPFLMKVSGIEATADATDNGELTFVLPADDLNKLAVGVYQITVESQGRGLNNAVPPTDVGTLTVTEYGPSTWTVPKTLKASRGLQYALLQTTPEGRTDTGVTFKSSNKKIAAVDDQGVVTALKKGKATITATGASSKPQTCVVTVVGNTYSRAKPLILPGGGLFSSTKALSFPDGKIKIELYVYNCTGEKVKGVTQLTFELRQKGKAILTKALPDWTPKNAIKDKGHGVYKLTLTKAELETLTGYPFDLRSGEIQAVLIGKGPDDVALTPLTPDMPGVTKPKDGEVVKVDSVVEEGPS